jgi:hypothetical protein
MNFKKFLSQSFTLGFWQKPRGKNPGQKPKKGQKPCPGQKPRVNDWLKILFFERYGA